MLSTIKKLFNFKTRNEPPQIFPYYEQRIFTNLMSLQEWRLVDDIFQKDKLALHHAIGDFNTRLSIDEGFSASREAKITRKALASHQNELSKAGAYEPNAWEQFMTGYIVEDEFWNRFLGKKT